MIRISKDFHFSASHVLGGLPAGHQCGRMHGHNYVLTMELAAKRAELDEVGFVRDFDDLRMVKEWIDQTLDHVHLNDVAGIGNPTSENIACWVFDVWCERLPELSAVRLSETPRTWAEYRPRAEDRSTPHPRTERGGDAGEPMLVVNEIFGPT